MQASWREISSLRPLVLALRAQVPGRGSEFSVLTYKKLRC